MAYGYRIRPTVKGCSWENAVAEVADEAAVFLEKFSEDVGYVPVQLWCVSCKGAYRQIRSIFFGETRAWSLLTGLEAGDTFNAGGVEEFFDQVAASLWMNEVARSLRVE